jgi:hypothetical protein
MSPAQGSALLTVTWPDWSISAAGRMALAWEGRRRALLDGFGALSSRCVCELRNLHLFLHRNLMPEADVSFWQSTAHQLLRSLGNTEQLESWKLRLLLPALSESHHVKVPSVA